MDNLIKESLEKSISYEEYRDLVKHLVAKESTSGLEKTDALINYTMLNDRRMKRWDKTLKISEAHRNIVNEFDAQLTWLVLTESWCGDAAHLIPVMNKLAELNPNIELRIVFRDENEALMDAFLTNGNRSIAKLIMVDNCSLEVMATYGPRPSLAAKMVNDYKERHGILTPEFKEDLQRWYNNDKGQTTIKDLTEILEALRFSSKIKSDCT